MFSGLDNWLGVLGEVMSRCCVIFRCFLVWVGVLVCVYVSCGALMSPLCVAPLSTSAIAVSPSLASSGVFITSAVANLFGLVPAVTT